MMILVDPNIIGISAEAEDGEHRILPIFTCADTAVEFMGGTRHDDGSKFNILNINTEDSLDYLKDEIVDKSVDLIILDPPFGKWEDALLDRCWTGEDFVKIIEGMLVLGEAKPFEGRVVKFLDKYLTDCKKSNNKK